MSFWTDSDFRLDAGKRQVDKRKELRMAEHVLPRVKDVVEATLREQYGNVFELISVRPDFDEYGDEILVIKAVFGKDGLGGQRTSGLIRHLRPKLAEVGTEAFPVISFIAKSELRDRDLEALRSY